MPFDLAASLAAAHRQNARGCVKIEEDLQRYEEVIRRSRPDGIIECLPGDTLVTLPPGGAVRAVRRTHTGPMVEITLTGGDTLTATPNHEVLTRDGWLPAGAVQEGDNLVSNRLLQRMGVGDPYVDHMPTPIAQVFDAWQGRASQRRTPGGMYLNRRGADGQVEVVAVDSYLRADREAALFQPRPQQRLARADLSQGSLTRPGTTGQHRRAHSPTPDGLMGEFLHGGMALRIAPEPHESSLSLGARSRTRPTHGRPNRGAAPAILRSQSDNRLTGEVPTDRVISVRTFPYSGHVYNLQTGTGVYGAAGIIVHNCGTFSGKSALFFARTAKAPVFTVDVHMQVDPATQEEWIDARVLGHVGHSTSPHTAWAVKEWMSRAQVTRPMVVLDSDHSADTVYDEMRLYGRLVKPGGYMIVEDTLVRWMPSEWVENGGPYRGSPFDAVEKFLAGADAWEVDREIEGMFDVTQYPSGWLRRAR